MLREGAVRIGVGNEPCSQAKDVNYSALTMIRGDSLRLHASLAL